MALDYGPFDSRMDLEKLKRWKDQDFPPASPARAKFEDLCHSGCDPKLLWSILNLAVLHSQCQRTIYDVCGVSRSALVKLPEKLEEVSRELESVNLLLGWYIQANFSENPDLPEQVRSRSRQQTAVYRTTPKLLRLLAGHLRLMNEWVQHNFGPKRFDTFRKAVLELLQYVDTCTGNPHYEDIADLLDHLFSVKEKEVQTLAKGLHRLGWTGAKKKQDMPPKLISSPDALKALYRRSAGYGFRKNKT